MGNAALGCCGEAAGLPEEHMHNFAVVKKFNRQHREDISETDKELQRLHSLPVQKMGLVDLSTLEQERVEPFPDTWQEALGDLTTCGGTCMRPAAADIIELPQPMPYTNNPADTSCGLVYDDVYVDDDSPPTP
eukprot:gnl/MRDRNA2_/MRDRNA2_56342_c0_seq1.p1 gnl/MRDRNA2_/MRDRNA2_56342_c0~~gnl/MRDRNA2_/MRDRNA2_56342_c0_seq1.p1  ORF type:complete len:133 (-),score=27.88 gnl/MRDRNA2_/MRDRNA2_56342_c0_seq1:50-448(-)